MQRLNQPSHPYGHILAYLIASYRSRKSIEQVEL